MATDATWLTNAQSSDWNTASNWSTGSIPTGTAFFGASDQTAIQFLNNDVFHPVSIAAIEFNPGAPLYSFSFGYLSLTGAGVINQSNTSPVFTPYPGNCSLTFLNQSSASNATLINNATSGTFAHTDFRNASNAGSATIINTGATYFYDNSSAANATISNTVLYWSNGGFTWFNNQSTAANAVINNSSGGQTIFSNTSTAANAQINNSGSFNFGGGFSPTVTSFTDSSTAANSAIANSNGGRTEFQNTSTAANAIITNGGIDPATGWYATTYFYDNSSAANSIITNNQFGYTFFMDTSSGGQARIINNAGGTFDISFLSSGGTSVGSIEGAGYFFLGSNTLTTGSNNLTTEVNGIISGAEAAAE